MINDLMQAFEQIYPDKTGIFFIDQAQFHVNRVAFSNSSYSKKEILEHNKHYNISQKYKLRALKLGAKEISKRDAILIRKNMHSCVSEVAHPKDITFSGKSHK